MNAPAMNFFPTDLASFLEIIRQNGEVAYSLIFAWASSHSLLLTLFAGYAAFSGALHFGTLVGVCWFGSFFGDVFRFWVGRKFGIGWLKRYPRLHGAVEKAVLLSGRHYTWMILTHRYPHGIRGIAALAYGASPLPWRVFLPLNVVASGIWALAIVSAGYAFGRLSEKVMNDASSSLGVIMLVVFLGLSWLLSRRFEAAVEREAAAEKAGASLSAKEKRKAARLRASEAKRARRKPA
ncbi:MAG: DedA family protein [Beijerinckiaceae bacterium]